MGLKIFLKHYHTLAHIFSQIINEKLEVKFTYCEKAKKFWNNLQIFIYVTYQCQKSRKIVSNFCINFKYLWTIDHRKNIFWNSRELKMKIRLQNWVHTIAPIYWSSTSSWLLRLLLSIGGNFQPQMHFTVQWRFLFISLKTNFLKTIWT